MASIPVALQLYSVRKECEADLPGTLRAVRDMGYTGVEFAGYYGRSAKELRGLLDDLGLRVAGTHTGLATVQDDQLQQTIEFNQAIGNRNLVVPSIPREQRESHEAWLKLAEFFNQLVEKLAPHGMRAGYHNHNFEFRPLPGTDEVPWDRLGRLTRPEFILQLDLGNAIDGDADPMPYLRKYVNRAVTVHLKDRSPANENALLGEGEVPWSEVFALCEGSGVTEWYIVEQERYPVPPLESARRCREALQKMGR